MPVALIVAPTAVIAIVLITSGAAKLRRPDDEEGWAQLGVPAALRRQWLIRLHPIGEIVLAVALLALGGAAGTAAAGLAALLFSSYLVLVWRAWRATPDASCACFGRRRPIGARTIVRNSWLVLLAVLSALTVGAAPRVGGVAVLVLESWPWAIAAVIAVVTALLVWESPGADSAVGSSPGGDGGQALMAAGDVEYVRTRTPAVMISLADGTEVNLRDLAARGPILLLAVSESCAACGPVIARVPSWRTLLPEVSVRLLLQLPARTSALADTSEPQTLHDPWMRVRDSIDDWVTPTAVLVGADGYLAGGPVTGAEAIEDFVGDVYEALHGVRPPADASA